MDDHTALNNTCTTTVSGVHICQQIEVLYLGKHQETEASCAKINTEVKIWDETAENAASSNEEHLLQLKKKRFDLPISAYRQIFSPSTPDLTSLQQAKSTCSLSFRH